MLGIGVNVVITESQMEDGNINFLSELSPTNEAISNEEKVSNGFFNF